MYHSITFGDKNTWDDWHLVPSSRPVFNPPKLKTKYLDIPGSSGHLDLTESLTGYPVYENREGSFEFIVMNGYDVWHKTYSDIMDYLHGQQMKAILEDDPAFFYEGRFTINEWNSKSPPRSTITIDYNVDPYKWSVISSVDEWKWDPFNFRTGVIWQSKFRNIRVSSDSSWTTKTFTKEWFGRAPICPWFTVSSSDGKGIHIRFRNPKLGIEKEQLIKDGTTRVPDIIFFGDTVYLDLKGIGTVSIDFRFGRL